MTEHDSMKKSQDPVAGFILSKADNKTRFTFANTLPALLEYEAEGFNTERLYLESGVHLLNNDCNKKIRDSVDSLLAQAGYSEDSSVRHGLSMMNFGTTDSHSVDKDKMAKRLLADKEAKENRDAVWRAQGICPDCEGAGELGGQFTGGMWECETCLGTGKYEN